MFMRMSRRCEEGGASENRRRKERLRELVDPLVKTRSKLTLLRRS